MSDPFASVITNWPQNAKHGFDHLRRIILQTADQIENITIVETLKWGEPSWLPDRPRIGSTLRAAWKPERPDHLSLFVNCSTTIAATMQEIYPNAFFYERNRALHFSLNMAAPEAAIAHCAAITFIYHRKTA